MGGDPWEDPGGLGTLWRPLRRAGRGGCEKVGLDLPDQAADPRDLTLDGWNWTGMFLFQLCKKHIQPYDVTLQHRQHVTQACR